MNRNLHTLHTYLFSDQERMEKIVRRKKNCFIGPNEAEKFLKKTAETKLMEEFSRF